ncbi:Leucine-rich repeat receptor-like protein kinase pxc2 [Thalictrum thalictroides]|uniref:Leucine-rich repeat receptor-like protein kinase pxc2 n=1 Tax=Thalictrum thalictroides TaxID=46969 RepID=A0A7J6VKU9_THATH|nr:Leucine-rich repeat receptor-like protein kinase pxc2 [Thalictrum thalictroides]
MLNLDDNNFNHSQMPTAISNFPMLMSLNIAASSFFGEIPAILGKLRQLTHLDISNNNFHGPIPDSYANLTQLQTLRISGCNLVGPIPSWISNLTSLVYLDLAFNKLDGSIPTSVSSLKDLRILYLQNNLLNGNLPQLKILAIRYNGFHDVIGKPENGNIGFPDLRILDLSYNNFTAIDLSNNKFEGIDPLVGKLKGLRSLNISHNMISGSIPSSLGNLTLLESLDLSDNKLSGYIPQQLAQLTFLSKFNVSHNNLTGSIPQGPQVKTFDITSYEGNLGLCGAPLLIKCGKPKTPQPPDSTGEDDDSSDTGFVSGLDWIFVVSGFVGGSVVGVVLSDIFVTRKLAWLIKIAVKMRLMKQKRETGRRRNRIR